MATTAKLNRSLLREKLVAQHAEKRKALKAVATNLNLSDEEREQAMSKLRKLSKLSHPNRLRRRCSLTGRPRAVSRKFGICRHKLRELAHKGEIPGCKKASW